MTTASPLAGCTWQDDGAPEALAVILAFLAEIGIDVQPGEVSESVLEGMTARCGKIVVDRELPVWAGDLLHEAGHIALSDPATRAMIDQVSDDPGEEMGAIAWSFAAARHLGIDPAIVFHREGYRGGGESIAREFVEGRYFGVPMLALYGMTAEPHRAEASGIAAYPAMQRWLR